MIFRQIPLEVVRSLDLLLEGSTNHNRTNVQPIHRLLSEDPLQSQAGYSAITCCFNLHKLLSCVQHFLTLNPFGMSACLRSGKKLAWDQQGMRNSPAVFLSLRMFDIQGTHCVLSPQLQLYPVIDVAVSKVKASDSWWKQPRVSEGKDEIFPFGSEKTGALQPVMWGQETMFCRQLLSPAFSCVWNLSQCLHSALIKEFTVQMFIKDCCTLFSAHNDRTVKVTSSVQLMLLNWEKCPIVLCDWMQEAKHDIIYYCVHCIYHSVKKKKTKIKHQLKFLEHHRHQLSPSVMW